MLRKWLQSDPEASWERLSAALTLTGHKTTAAVIRSQFPSVRADSNQIQREADGKRNQQSEQEKIRKFQWLDITNYPARMCTRRLPEKDARGVCTLES